MRRGSPTGAFRTLLVGSPAVAGLIGDARIAAVTLTGSDHAGRVVGEQAGRAIKKSVLELGGGDPFIVLADADVIAAARAAADARLVNSGQSCIAAKRFIVVQPIADRFLDRFKAELSSRRMGDPLDPKIRSGLKRGQIFATSSTSRSRNRSSGERGGCSAARPRPGQGPSTRRPCWPPSTRGCRPSTRRPLIRAKNEGDAIRLANDSTFGLGASLWTRDRTRAESLAARIEAGCVFVNGIVKSDPRLPFGGIKRSGYGRELSEYGIREFVNIKSVWMA